MSQKFEIVVPKAWHDWAIDKAMVAALPQLSRRQIRRALDAGGVFLNQKRIDRASAKVKTGQKILLLVSEQSEKPKAVFLQEKDILYFKNDVLAINKGPYIAVQKGKSDRATNIEALVKDYGKKTKLFSQAVLCHRLDKDTTGVLLFATTDARASQIMEMFKNKTIKKCYWAICQGIPTQKSWHIKNHLSEIDKKTGKVMVVKSGGRTAITDFTLLKSNSKAALSLIECYPLTGRSHQLRVHLSSTGLPIVSDKKYGSIHATKAKNNANMESDHHLLHAKSISFQLPEMIAPITIEAPLPINFKKALQKYF